MPLQTLRVVGRKFAVFALDCQQIVLGIDHNYRCVAAALNKPRAGESAGNRRRIP